MVAFFERLQTTVVAYCTKGGLYHTLLSRVGKVHHFCIILTIWLLNSCVVEVRIFSWHIETQERLFEQIIFSMLMMIQHHFFLCKYILCSFAKRLRFVKNLKGSVISSVCKLTVKIVYHLTLVLPRFFFFLLLSFFWNSSLSMVPIHTLQNLLDS